MRGNLPIVVGSGVAILVLTYMAVQAGAAEARARPGDPGSVYPSVRQRTWRNATERWRAAPTVYADRRGSCGARGSVRVLCPRHGWERMG